VLGRGKYWTGVEEMRRRAGTAWHVAPSPGANADALNLMDALKKSLNAVSATKKKPAKAAVAVAPTRRDTQTRVKTPATGPRRRRTQK
jgi:hypothetical protein